MKMRITRQEDYAITLIAALANKSKDYVALSEIGLNYHLPVLFLKKIARKLKTAGILEVKEGRGGGYRLAKPLRDISMETILRVFNPDPFLTTCSLGEHQAKCSKFQVCKSRGVWQQISQEFYKDLKKISLAEITK